ncbi:class I SAM-dependent methyltransferase [Anaeromyxobacter sp. Red801]|uniref:class I SAM-dependent methyltransferase n=1 Tax=Anaeromyxobacter sp. Red801 TaxID=3411632 RepID=UPI003BA25EE1
MSLSTKLLEHPAVYRLWQSPFAADKLAPLVQHGQLSGARRVLDVGCGPGTNTAAFSGVEYVGIDINPAYIASARRRFAREFVVADICTYAFQPERKFDFVLANSFLHHVADRDAERILAGMAGALTPDGAVHILDLVLPEDPSIARFLARQDRGAYARPLEEWRALFGRVFELRIFETYSLSLLGVPLWKMVYCKGEVK